MSFPIEHCDFSYSYRIIYQRVIPMFGDTPIFMFQSSIIQWHPMITIEFPISAAWVLRLRENVGFGHYNLAR